MKIVDSDKQIKELRDKGPIKLEVDNDKAHGEQFITFRKDGKEYPVLVKVDMKRGFIKDGPYSAKFEIPKNADFTYYHEKDGPIFNCKLVQPLRVGRVVALSIFSALAIGGIIAMIL